MPRLLILSALGITVLPKIAAAMTLVQVFGVFHLFVGLFLTATLFVFAAGVFVYFARLGTWPTHRDTAIEVMEWGIAMMFVLIVILGLVEFFQSHPRVALSILAFVIIVAILFFILRVAAGDTKKKAPPAGARPSSRAPAPRR